MQTPNKIHRLLRKVPSVRGGQSRTEQTVMRTILKLLSAIGFKAFASSVGGFLLLLSAATVMAQTPSCAVTITSPAPNTTVSGTVTVGVTDACTAGSFSFNRLYVGTVPTPPTLPCPSPGECVQFPAGSEAVQWNTSALPNGVYYLNVGVWNSTGLVKEGGTSQGIEVTIANGASVPTATPQPTPAPDPSGCSVAIASPTSGASLSGTATVSLTESCAVAVFNRLYVGNSTFQFTGTTFAFDTTTQPDGPTGLALIAWDSTGTIREATSAPVSVTIANGTTSPTPTVTTTASPKSTFTPTGAFVPRTDYGQRLEPIGNAILSDVGQDMTGGGISTYSNFVSAIGVYPAVYMSYESVGLSPASTLSWAQGLKSELSTLSPNPIMVQVGYDMCASYCNGSNDVTAQIVAGDYDANLQGFCTALQTLGVPVYVRIGYEFNGGWNSYNPGTYPGAFQVVANALHACSGVRVATVWDVSVVANTPYTQYYPGDSYVDWWGANYYPASDFTNPYGIQFVADSQTHRKPLMFGEASPQTVGAEQGLTSWDTWFVPFFNLVNTTPNLKMYTYINANWALTAWPYMGDAIIPADSVVAQNFQAQLAGKPYLFSSAGLAGELH